jgi:hypothetical protein
VASACTGTVSITTGKGGVTPHCMDQAFLYYAGFALTIVSLVALAIVLVGIATRERYDRRRIRRHAITVMQRREAEGQRKAA